MDDLKSFLVFSDEMPESGADDALVEVPTGCGNREELFAAFRDQLGLPKYFGANWDAFSECLRDLSWVGAKKVVLLHRGIPLDDRGDLRIYLDVLTECIGDWKGDEDHELVAIFPTAFQAETSSLLADQIPPTHGR